VKQQQFCQQVSASWQPHAQCMQGYGSSAVFSTNPGSGMPSVLTTSAATRIEPTARRMRNRLCPRRGRNKGDTVLVGILVAIGRMILNLLLGNVNSRFQRKNGVPGLDTASQWNKKIAFDPPR
jgi:hypothetical protein